MMDPNYTYRHAGRNMIRNLFLAILEGKTAEEFAEKQLRRMKCDWCVDNFPIGEDGWHYIPGHPELKTGPCDAQETG
jgi:hypothetical protein